MSGTNALAGTIGKSRGKTAFASRDRNRDEREETPTPMPKGLGATAGELRM